MKMMLSMPSTISSAVSVANASQACGSLRSSMMATPYCVRCSRRVDHSDARMPMTRKPTITPSEIACGISK